jgi:hypothetical protein
MDSRIYPLSIVVSCRRWPSIKSPWILPSGRLCILHLLTSEF